MKTKRFLFTGKWLVADAAFQNSDSGNRKLIRYVNRFSGLS